LGIEQGGKRYKGLSKCEWRLREAEWSSRIESGREGSLVDESLYRIDFRIDKDTPIDKEYTGIDKITMCICGQCASFATQAVRTIGCDGLAVEFRAFQM
jgi:hypothetical protein